MSEPAKKVLIAEDEKPIARALELKLNRLGLITKTVFNGEDALKLSEKERFDLMIIDLVMPEVDGFEVIAELRARKNNVPIIVLSNLSQEEDIKKAKELGVTDYFVKSDTPLAEIIKHVKKILNL